MYQSALNKTNSRVYFLSMDYTTTKIPFTPFNIVLDDFMFQTVCDSSKSRSQYLYFLCNIQ